MLPHAARWVLITGASALSILAQSSAPGVIVGAGYTVPTPLKVAPGQIITVFASGVGSTLTKPVLAGPGNLPTSLAGINVTIRQGTDTPAPILQVSPVNTCGSGCGVITAITIQVPYALIATCVPTHMVCPASPAIIVASELFVSENGVAGTLSALSALPDQVHVLTICDTVRPGMGIPPGFSGLPCQPVVTHADGTLVSNISPASVGEELVAYAVGLGATTPAVPTGQAAAQPTPTVEAFLLDFNFHPNALPAQPLPIQTIASLTPPPAPLFTGLTPGYPGLYQVNFVVPPLPSGTLPCASGISPLPQVASTNLTVSLGGSSSFDGAGICVALGTE